MKVMNLMESDGSSGSKTPNNKNLLKGYNYSFKILDPSKTKIHVSESDITITDLHLMIINMKYG